MPDFEVSKFPALEERYEALTATEKTIADFFITNEELEDLSAKTMANRLHVSEATLSRFAKSLGFSGYREFVFAYRTAHALGSEQAQGQVAEVFSTYQEILQKTISLIDPEQVERIVELLKTKKRTFVYGFGHSALVAQDIMSRFLCLGLDVDVMSEFHEIMINEARVNSDSLVIGISLSGATGEVTEAMLEAKRNRGAATILITSKNDGKWEEEFDEVLLTAGINDLEYGSVISPQFPVLVVLDMLYAAYAKDHPSVEARRGESTLWSKIKRYRT